MYSTIPKKQLHFFLDSGKEFDLRMATVRASGEVAHGQMTSGFKPCDWKTLRKASQDDTDPASGRQNQCVSKRGWKMQNMRSWKSQLTWVCSICNNQHAYRGQVRVLLFLVGHHGPVEVTAFDQGHSCCWQTYTGLQCYIYTKSSYFKLVVLLLAAHLQYKWWQSRKVAKTDVRSQSCGWTFVNVDPLHPGHGTCFHDSVRDCDGVDSVHDTLKEEKKNNILSVVHTQTHWLKNSVLYFSVYVILQRGRRAIGPCPSCSPARWRVSLLKEAGQKKRHEKTAEGWKTMRDEKDF